MASLQMSPQPPARKRKGRSLSQSRTDINYDYDRDAFAFNHYSGFLKHPLKRHLSSDIAYFMPNLDSSSVQNSFLSKEYISRPPWVSQDNISTQNTVALQNHSKERNSYYLNQSKSYSKKRSHSAEHKTRSSSRENIKRQLQEQQVQVQHHIKQLQDQLELIRDIRLSPVYKNTQSELLSLHRENQSNISQFIQTDASVSYNDKQDTFAHSSVTSSEKRNSPSNKPSKVTNFSSESKSQQNESNEGYVFFADEENSENETVLELQMNEIENDSSWDEDSRFIDDENEKWNLIRERELQQAEEELIRQRKEFANQQHLFKEQREELEKQKKQFELDKDKFNEMISNSNNPSTFFTQSTPKTSSHPIRPFRRRSVTPIQSKLRPLPINQSLMLENLAFPLNNTSNEMNSFDTSAFQRPSTPTPSNLNSFKSTISNSSFSNKNVQPNIHHNIRLATKLNRTPTPQILRPAASTGILNTFDSFDKNLTPNSPHIPSRSPSYSKLDQTDSFFLSAKQTIIPEIIQPSSSIEPRSPSPLPQKFSCNSNLLSHPSSTSLSSSPNYICEKVSFTNKRQISPSSPHHEASNFFFSSKSNKTSFSPIVPERNRRIKSPTFTRNLSSINQKESSPSIPIINSTNYNQINGQVPFFQQQQISPIRVKTRQVPQRPPSPKPFKKIPQRPPSPRKLTGMSTEVSPTYETHNSSILQVPKIPPRSLSASSLQMKSNEQLPATKVLSTKTQESFRTITSNSETFMDHFSQYASPHIKYIKSDELENVKENNDEKQGKSNTPKNEASERLSKTLNVNDINSNSPLTERRRTLPDALKALNVEPVILDSKNCKKKHSLQISEIHANPLSSPPLGWDREKVSEMAHQAREAKMNENKYGHQLSLMSITKWFYNKKFIFFLIMFNSVLAYFFLNLLENTTEEISHFKDE